jgi:hypothetical protein
LGAFVRIEFSKTWKGVKHLILGMPGRSEGARGIWDCDG